MQGYKVLDTSAVVISHGAARMLVAVCADCGLACVPRLLRCSRCHGTRFRPQALAPAGVLYAFSEVAVAPKGCSVPYLVGYADMQAGIRLFARLAFDAKVARLGMAVELELQPCPGQAGRYVYQFQEARSIDLPPASGAGLAGVPSAAPTELQQGLAP